MRWKLINADPPVTYAVVLQTGDDAVQCLSDFVRDQEIEAASLTAIGAFRRAVLGYFDWQSKQYKKIPVEEQVEVLSLIGDVAVSEGQPTLHIHAVLGKSDGSVVGGHLLSGEVRPTLEVIVTQSPSYLRKVKDPETGLALISIDPVTQT
jgi:predicted DNA-binding protein with PD1-like motif